MSFPRGPWEGRIRLTQTQRGASPPGHEPEGFTS